MEDDGQIVNGQDVFVLEKWEKEVVRSDSG